MRLVDRRGICLVACGVLICGGAWTVSLSQDPEHVGSPRCAECHEEVVREFLKTGHAIGGYWDEEKGCESCHGPGERHVESGDPADIVNPRDLPPRQTSETCLECHQGTRSQFRGRHAVHNLGQISCLDCHDSHSSSANMLPERGIALCETCHAGIAGQFDNPRSHPMPDATSHLPNRLASGPPGCEGCHNPHTEIFRTAGAARGFGNVDCLKCHTDKAGPFVYPHGVGIVDGCQSCHSVHGGPNRHLLTHERKVNLCYECHTALTTPAFHSAQGFVNEKCTACHTAIHGSNTNAAFLEE